MKTQLTYSTPSWQICLNFNPSWLINCSVNKKHKHTIAYGTKTLYMVLYLIVVHTLHLP